MKTYIERAAVETMLENAQIITDGEYCGYCTEDVSLDSIPTADVVEVVRCKNCFYYKPFGECNNTGSTVKPDDYCSYGARMDKEVKHEAG